MPALAEIKKKPQREAPPDRTESREVGKSSKPTGTPLHLVRELVRLHELEGLSYQRAYRKVWPERKATPKSAAELGRRLIGRYMREHGRELQEMLMLHGLGEDRFAKELDQRYKAKTLHEIVRSEAKKVKLKDGRESYKVLTLRNTIEVEDNATRMRATELHADVLGARKTPAGGGVQQNIAVIYVVGGKIKKKRQERIVSS